MRIGTRREQHRHEARQDAIEQSEIGLWIAELGTARNDAILAIVEGNNPASAPANATVIYAGPGLTSSGANSTVIQADNRGFGNASIDASGNLSGFVGTPGGQFMFGLDAVAGDDQDTGIAGAGDATVHYRAGTINVSGFFAVGIYASAGNGSSS